MFENNDSELDKAGCFDQSTPDIFRFEIGPAGALSGLVGTSNTAISEPHPERPLEFRPGAPSWKERPSCWPEEWATAPVQRPCAALSYLEEGFGDQTKRWAIWADLLIQRSVASGGPSAAWASNGNGRLLPYQQRWAPSGHPCKTYLRHPATPRRNDFRPTSVQFKAMIAPYVCM